MAAATSRARRSAVRWGHLNLGGAVMARAEGIQSVNWNAPDPAAAERFYTEVLGGKVTTRHQVRGVDVVRIRVGSTGLGIFDASAGPASGVPHHTFKMSWVADQDEAAGRLEGAG